MASDITRNAATWIGYLITSVISVAVAIFVLVYFQDRLPRQTLGPKSDAVDLQPQTEETFLNGLSSLPEKYAEWWSARADHRLLAQALFNCQANNAFQINSMPRQYYRTLLMDLTPSGDHAFVTSAADTARLVAIEKNAKPLLLDDNGMALLALSDSIARARITAADGASINVPWVQRLGIATVVISALATLFVTLQGRMRPVEMDDGKRKEFEQSPFYSRVNYSLFGSGSGFRWVAFFAIALSIAGTSLAGLKQVYDPTRTLTQNTRSLLELRQLHQEVVLAVQCESEKNSKNQKWTDWNATLYRLRGNVLPEYGAYAALDLNTNAPPKDGSGHNPGPPTNTPAPAQDTPPLPAH
jgi:hypothetical protein